MPIHTVTLTLELKAEELETLDRSIAEAAQTDLGKELVANGFNWDREDELRLMLLNRLRELRRLHDISDNLNSLRAQEMGVS
jgi:hypothetical protein